MSNQALLDRRADWNALATRSGLSLDVRPATPEDEPALAEFFSHVSREDLRFRFLSGVVKVGAEQLRRLIDVDHVGSEDFLAFDGETLIASAMVVADEKREMGEVAIAVRDDYKGRGVGWSLLRHVARFAKANGLSRLFSVESRANRAAIELEREMGFSVRPYPGDSTLVAVEVDLNSLDL